MLPIDIINTQRDVTRTIHCLVANLQSRQTNTYTGKVERMLYVLTSLEMCLCRELSAVLQFLVVFLRRYRRILGWCFEKCY